MIDGFITFLTIFTLSAFTGYEVINRVPVILHTPLMSGTNFIHGIILIGAMIALGQAHSVAEQLIGFFAVLIATINVVGGFVVTKRMLEMFQTDKNKMHNFIQLIYLLTAIILILGIRKMSSPKTAKQGIIYAGWGMMAAI